MQLLAEADRVRMGHGRLLLDFPLEPPSPHDAESLRAYPSEPLYSVATASTGQQVV